MAYFLWSALGVYLFFIWVLCRACTLADEREGFWDM